MEANRTLHYDLAIADFNEVIRLKPDLAEAYDNRGFSYAQKGDYDRAIADFSEAIRLKPFAEAYNDRGATYARKADWDKAISDCTEAVRLKPDFAVAYFNRGHAYGHKGDYDKAIADFNEAIRLKPDFTEAYDNRGYSYELKGDYNKALDDYNGAIRLSPTNAVAYADLAWLLAVCPDANIRKGEKAVEYAKKACELSEFKNSEMFDNLAVAYAEAGDFDDAVKWENNYLESNLSKDVTEKARQRLSLYEQKKPYHEEKP